MQLLSYTAQDGVALIQMDDQGNNLISPAMVDELNQALDRAEAEGCIVILTGAREVFSAGFDLKILRSGVTDTFSMLIGGFKLSQRLMSFPRPVVIACNGHAIAMGVFLVLSADYRIGVAGDYKYLANEVKNGLTVPHAALTVCRYRLKPSYFDRVVNLSESFAPSDAINAGFLDEVVQADQLIDSAKVIAHSYKELNADAFKRTKLRMRREVLKQMSKAIWNDRIDFIRMGLARLFKR